MSLVEENLPGVSKVRKNFQVQEDSVLARQLQEQEYDEHFNYNVQSRRTAMQDTQIAKKAQMVESEKYKREEQIRRQQLLSQAELDALEAQRIEQALHREEEERRKEDEEYVKRLHQEQLEHDARLREQEEVDSRLAQQHSERERMEAEEKRRREVEIGEEAAKRLQHLEIANSGGNVEMFKGLPTYDSLGFGPPPTLPPPPGEEEEEFVDETARLEEEDARLAQELMEREEREAARRRQEQEQADIEFAKRLMEEEQKRTKPSQNPTDSDMEYARRLMEEEEKRRQLSRSTADSDMELAQRLHSTSERLQSSLNALEEADRELAEKMRADLQRQESEREKEDWEVAKRLQKQELIKAKKAKARQQSLQDYNMGGDISTSLPRAAPPQHPSPTRSVPATLPSHAPPKRIETDPMLMNYAPLREPNDDSEVPSPRQAIKRQKDKDKKKAKIFNDSPNSLKEETLLKKVYE